jgi:ribosomal protein S18 acetylase RimI-like enzyme
MIRPYREADFGAVVELWQACDLTRPWNPPARDIAFCRASGHGELFVAEAEGRVVGTIMAGHDGHRGWLYYVAVDPARRRGGLGRRLVDHALAALRAQGVPKVELMIRETNVQARGFYEKLGWSPEPVVVMSRWLDK